MMLVNIRSMRPSLLRRPPSSKPLIAFFDSPPNQPIKLFLPLGMYPMPRLLELDKLRLGHGLLEQERVLNPDQMVLVPGDEGDLGYVAGDVPEPLRLDVVREPSGHLGKVPHELLWPRYGSAVKVVLSM